MIVLLPFGVVQFFAFLCSPANPGRVTRSVLPDLPSSTVITIKQELTCDVLIIGSGFAGSFAAYKLAPRLKGRLCQVEKLTRDGGRIYDVSEYPDGPVFGAGALRLIKEQSTMLALAKELDIDLQEVADDVEVIKVRGRHFYRRAQSVNLMCRDMFPTLNCTTHNGNQGN